MNIGVAGLGAMGSNVAARLMEVGHQVTVWNRSPDKTKPLAAAGAKWRIRPPSSRLQAKQFITLLTDGAAIDAVYNGPKGLLSGEVKDKLFIEMSTGGAQGRDRSRAQGARHGAVMVECPVGGSTTPARQGKLLGLMGAEPADAARAKPILEQLCRKVEHCGPVGARRRHQAVDQSGR